ncbi:unnamed protein product [Schistosoma curassoni]|uniref:Uncharacterized protein n=1 Tax=Schistosoma curassoni TaxID=6186 RepID=A0A183JKU0_9TREM|nr:unnamed protein product [Schistosoma curassoni]
MFVMDMQSVHSCIHIQIDLFHNLDNQYKLYDLVKIVIYSSIYLLLQ